MIHLKLVFTSDCYNSWRTENQQGASNDNALNLKASNAALGKNDDTNTVCKIDPLYDVAAKVQVEFKLSCGASMPLFCLNVKK